VSALALVTIAASCHHAAPAASSSGSAAATPSLYQRLGGETGVRAVASQLVDNIAGDTRISHFFADSDLPALKTSLATLIGQSTGGPEKYAGRDMKTTHAGLGIHDTDFDALIEDLGKALDQNHVADKEKAELIAILMPLKRDIVER